MNHEQIVKVDLDPESLRGRLPEGPGVYLFKDRTDQVIYIGKAKNLKKRVMSYFKSSADMPYKTAMLMKRAKNLDFFLTATEKEAFILESNLVKKYMPRYNIILRDDKQYPALRLDIQNPFPRLSVVRRIKKDGALYFGPYSSANSMRSTLKLINRIFHLRKCKGPTLPKRSRPCLNHQLGRCLGACVHEVSQSRYREIVGRVRLFLEGRNHELIRQLKKDMASASENLNFERAAGIRDQIRSVENVMERQNVVSPKLEDQDVIGLAQAEGLFMLVHLFVRKGYLSGTRDYVFKQKGGPASEVMEAFLKQYYPKETFIPKQIFISEPVDDLDAISEWISDLAGKKVFIRRPMRGGKRRLVTLAVANAENLLKNRMASQKEDLMAMAKTALNLKATPRTMEGLDISNFQGDMAVGAIVSFLDGLPHKPGYRNYKIKNVEGIDDYGMISELVSRRLSKENPPDLFVVDGGKGHLMAVKRVLDGFHGKEIPEVVAIAKADERHPSEKVYVPGRKNPLSLRRDHPVLFLLMRIRDETHRRAITYHRKRRKKALKESRLDRIPGIGLKRKQLLLQYFSDLHSISNAKLDDFEPIPGISRALAQTILETLKA
ncbi:excinuclease ABC subunit UvrC [bacterium]|nr:excinuclease ABC subunit UvrC [bacterium]